MSTCHGSKASASDTRQRGSCLLKPLAKIVWDICLARLSMPRPVALSEQQGLTTKQLLDHRGELEILELNKKLVARWKAKISNAVEAVGILGQPRHRLDARSSEHMTQHMRCHLFGFLMHLLVLLVLLRFTGSSLDGLRVAH